MRLYVDTNVFIDYSTNRLPCNFFERVLLNKWTIVISNVTLDELRHQKELTFVSNLLKFFDIEIVVSSVDDMLFAKTFRTHFNDALHIVLAAKSNCDYIITRNKRDFVESLIPVRGPNEKL